MKTLIKGADNNKIKRLAYYALRTIRAREKPTHQFIEDALKKIEGKSHE